MSVVLIGKKYHLCASGKTRSICGLDVAKLSAEQNGNWNALDDSLCCSRCLIIQKMLERKLMRKNQETPMQGVKGN